MTDELINQLEQLDPVDGERLRTRNPPEAELAEILAADPVATDRGSPRPRLLRPARVLPVAALAAAAIIAITALLPGDERGAASAAAKALESAAATAAAEPASPADGQFTYFRTLSTSNGTVGGPTTRDSYTWLIPITVEQWVAPDGSGRIRTVAGKAEFPDPDDVQDWRRSGSPRLGDPPGTVTERRPGPGELDGVPYEGGLPPVSELPADPDELESIFRDVHAVDGGDVPVEAKLFEYAASVLLCTGTRPELRAAVYEMAAGIDGVELKGELRDPLGRPGTGVSIETAYSGAPIRHTLIFDSETSYPLAHTQTPTGQPDHLLIKVPPVYTVLEETAAVADMHTRP